jgi:dTDP-4-dehydrorhamnose reductase
MKVLIAGAGGQVGRELRRADWPEGAQVTAFTREELDIADPQQVATKIARPLDLVINVAAYTAVDRAESEPVQASRVNASGPGLIADRCAALEIPLIHLSTDYVFSGNKNSPYFEDDEPGPLNQYGESKQKGEEAIRVRLREHVILRTASVFSEFGSNFVKTVLRLGADRESLRVVSDQSSCPTPALDIALAIIRVAAQLKRRERQELWGTYHYCGQPPVTWFQFAQEIFEVARSCGAATPKLYPIGAAEYAAAAVRPPNSAMDCGKIQRTLDIAAPSWAERLPAVVKAILGRGASL